MSKGCFNCHCHLYQSIILLSIRLLKKGKRKNYDTQEENHLDWVERAIVIVDSMPTYIVPLIISKLHLISFRSCKELIQNPFIINNDNIASNVLNLLVNITRYEGRLKDEITQSKRRDVDAPNKVQNISRESDLLANNLQNMLSSRNLDMTNNDEFRELIRGLWTDSMLGEGRGHDEQGIEILQNLISQVQQSAGRSRDQLVESAERENNNNNAENLLESEMLYNQKHEMNCAALDRMIKEDIAMNKRPCLVIANAGSPALGHDDPIHLLRVVCNKYRVWLHVRGPNLATKCLPKSNISLVAAGKADSITLQCAEWLGLPLVPSVTLLRHENLAFLGQMQEQRQNNNNFNTNKTYCLRFT